MHTVINQTNQSYSCDKCKSDVTLTTETVGVFSGDSGRPLDTFKRETCNAFPQVSACSSCSYSPLQKAACF